MQKKLSPAPQFHEGFFASADGLALYYRRYQPTNTPSNDAPTILCLPGVSRNHRDFLPLIDSGAMSANWILVDLRGRGHSQYDANPANYNPAVYFGDLLALLDHLQLASVDIIGTSLGGILAMLLNAQHPERVLRVVLNDIGAFVEKSAVENIGAYLRNAQSHASWNGVAQAIQPIYAEFFTDLSNDDWLALAKRLFREDGHGHIIPDYDPELFAHAAAAELDLWPLFNALRGKPTLVLRGANSALLPASMLAAMHASRPDLQSATVPARGHAPFLDEPVSLEAIRSFFATAR